MGTSFQMCAREDVYVETHERTDDSKLLPKRLEIAVWMTRFSLGGERSEEMSKLSARAQLKRAGRYRN